MKHAAVTLGSGNLRVAVMLPEGEDLNEWVAVNSMNTFCTFFQKKIFFPLKVSAEYTLMKIRPPCVLFYSKTLY